jgi:hypothetical protein
MAAPRATDDPDGEPDDDLVAYLDGELDGDESRKVEGEIAGDATTRRKLQSLKQTYDLLDYLPKSEPSPEFATKTLTQALPTGMSSLGVPSVRPAPRPWWAWIAAGVLAIAIGGAIGAGTRPRAVAEPITDELLATVARSPFYAGVDDIEFLRKLDRPDLFGDDPGEPGPPAAVRLDRPHDSESQSRLLKEFRALPAARRKRIVELDRHIYDLPTAERERTTRVLERYAVWLDRLPEAIRSGVLAATGTPERLTAVETALAKEWHETLPTEKQLKLKVMPDLNEKAALGRQWLDEELERRKEWQLAARQWQAVRDGKKPWPFDDERIKGELDAYVKTVLKLDPATTRLTSSELLKLELLRRNPERDFGWFLLGTNLLELSERHPSLPDGPEPPVTQLSQLPEAIRKEFAAKPNNFQQRLRNAQGRWPEFALMVDVEHRSKKGTLPNLGPARPGEFNATVEAFAREQLVPKLTPKQVAELKNLEGRWPEYPRKLVELCTLCDLSMPGVMLPGAPSLWKQYYRYAPPKLDKANGN